jgi:hypothetical protein
MTDRPTNWPSDWFTDWLADLLKMRDQSSDRRTERLPDKAPDILSNKTHLPFPNFLSYHTTYTQESPRHFLMVFPNNWREPFFLDRMAIRYLSAPCKMNTRVLTKFLRCKSTSAAIAPWKRIITTSEAHLFYAFGWCWNILPFKKYSCASHKRLFGWQSVIHPVLYTCRTGSSSAGIHELKRERYCLKQLWIQDHPKSTL